MTDRERLIELFEQMDINPEITCPKPNDVESCKTCKYAISEWLCDMRARKADYLLANGVIVPPCKVGDDVYYIIDGKIQALSVKYGTFVGNNITMSAKCKDESDMCEAGCWLDGKTCGIGFDYSHIGKTIFLTKEEAEQALKERDGNDR